MEGKRLNCVYFTVFLLLVLHYTSSNVEARRRYRVRAPPRLRPRPLVKVGNDIVSITPKPKPAQVDIAPLLNIGEGKGQQNRRTGVNSKSRYHSSLNKSPKRDHSQVFILRRRQPTSSYRNLNGFGKTLSLNQQVSYLSSNLPGLHQSEAFEGGNRRSYDTAAAQPQQQIRSDNTKLQQWLAYRNALQRSRGIKTLSSSERKAEYYRSLVPLLREYKRRKQAAEHLKYLRTLQLLALATSPDPLAYAPELANFAQSFKNSPYGSLLNSTFVPTDFVNTNNSTITGISNNATSANSTIDQVALASDANDRSEHGGYEYTSFQREIEKQRRKLLDVFPPPESEMPFGERTILMVRFPPVPHQKNNKEIIKLKASYDIDGGITFGGPRWFSFGTPFNPYDHPWNKEYQPVKPPAKYVLAEADRPSSYGVVITQNFVYKPSIRFTNLDPKYLAKHKGDILNGGPSIVSQLARALAEGNRISNSYFLSKAVSQGKKWTSDEKKPPFVIVHLDTYTRKTNVTGTLGLENQEEANYANGTIIYPTLNNPHVLASTKFEFHDGHEIDRIFDKPLATHGHDGYGFGQVPIHPKGIREIKNFIHLMYKVHQQAHDGGKTKVDELRNLGDKLEKPAFPDSKPLLRDQIADRSTSWLHTSSVGIRSLSEDDDHFPYDKHPLIDVSKDYGQYL